MNFAILMKQVPDTDEVKMDLERGVMIRNGVGGVVNPLDLNALEAAMRIREEGDSVSVLSMGPPKAEESLRECLALGADRAVLATDAAFAGGDTWATSKVLAAMLEHTGLPDLVIAGEKATDGETGQVGPEVAAMLGWPVATHVTGLKRTPGGVEVVCALEEGILTQRLGTPCLVTVLSFVNDLPLPTLSGKKRAHSLEVETLSARDLGIGDGAAGLAASPTRVTRIETPKIARRAEKFMAKRADELEAGLDRVIEILAGAAIL
ncbi:MAG: electron transfer flavoprotein subunit beta/FixA family protein [Synergistaceae bacterium]|jgi:electron transfer flavoprotein beta subunit|nr:electron transfer flavoprotein subunit beta/FixA family protein [Synergistaceae bacterium]